MVSSALGLVAAVATVLVPDFFRYVESRKADQLVGPFEFHAQPMGVLVHEVLEKMEKPVSMTVCRGLLSQPVTLSVKERIPLKSFVEILAKELGVTSFLRVGIHEETVQPTFLCNDGPPDLVLIRGADRVSTR